MLAFRSRPRQVRQFAEVPRRFSYKRKDRPRCRGRINKQKIRSSRPQVLARAAPARKGVALFSLSDSELDVLMTLAAPLDSARAIRSSARSRSSLRAMSPKAIGPGMINRVGRALQRQFMTPGAWVGAPLAREVKTEGISVCGHLTDTKTRPFESVRGFLLMSLCGREPPDGQTNVHSR
jgi:hypothetical protein